VDILGGGEYFEDLIYPEMIQPILSNNLPRHVALNVSDDSESMLSSCNTTSTAVNEFKYVYGKYQKTNPSSSSVALDLNSLSRLDRLARARNEANPLDPSDFSSRVIKPRPSTHALANVTSLGTNISHTMSHTSNSSFTSDELEPLENSYLPQTELNPTLPPATYNPRNQ